MKVNACKALIGMRVRVGVHGKEVFFKQVFVTWMYMYFNKFLSEQRQEKAVPSC